ncbi:PEP-utilizing enzyme [Arthrobacter sp. I2-34]|uniref:PEP-utilizing enzyme n=1 Tax=Arthrobacter hankyongi TaxID=2904801 RepID=A0ABS9L1Q9_9MICC|nr:PEP/pyruvate-binding domain-containing protein [Arthrobacter hankyongi]MCG2620582.1 PEP-utilizing enzyme [Arthrobacter hankyongi]
MQPAPPLPAGPPVLALTDARADLAAAGGKGASLARLACAGLHVPAGFLVTTGAYRAFLRTHRLQPALLQALKQDDAAASAAIGRLFAARPLPSETAAAIRQAYAGLSGPAGGPNGGAPVAVRSSATTEDLPGLSAAGQQDTFLGVSGAEDVLAAVRRCWASLWTERAIAYRRRHGIDPEHAAIAVVVQLMVPADAAGVLFTVNPLTGARDELVINAVWGLGESLVAGQATPDTLVLSPGGGVLRRSTADKTVMSAPDGTGLQPVPDRLRRAPVLTDAQAAELARAGAAVGRLYEGPVDIEWALRDGLFHILQARPATGLPAGPASAAAFDPAGEWNDSLAGNYLWSNGNFAEAAPDVMTPATWSFLEIFMSTAMASSSLPGFRAIGRIGGRPYMNMSLAMSMAGLVGISEPRFRSLTEDVYGRIPPDVRIPAVELPRWQVLRMLLPAGLHVMAEAGRAGRLLPRFLASAAERCETARDRIAGTATAAGLAALWRAELEPMLREYGAMLSVAGRQGGAVLVTVPKRLRKLAGGVDAELMLSGLSGRPDGSGAPDEGAGPDDGAGLASLGPLTGIGQVAAGSLAAADYLRRYGHRSPHEFEVSIPRPREDPQWLPRQLELLRGAPAPSALLARRREESDAAWRRFANRHPRRVRVWRRRVRRWATAARGRELVRSEVTRMFWVLRAYCLRAAELTGLGDGVFFLSDEEILGCLEGQPADRAAIAHRRALHAHYAALPAYPTVILGRFDPDAWARDPGRRTDFYRAGFPGSGDRQAPSLTISGFPGSGGLAEGVARVLASPDEAGTLGPGEILVTTLTNVGWTPVFPRAAAVVTDIGAPLSHAAIVARELGIPAVVGCGNATLHIRSGDRLRVDGANGVVEILGRSAAASTPAPAAAPATDE